MNKIFKIVIRFKNFIQTIQIQIWTKPRVERNEFDWFWIALYIVYKFLVYVYSVERFGTVLSPAQFLLTLCGTRKLQFFYAEILPEFKNKPMPKAVNAI